MSVQEHIEALRSKHLDLKQEIEQENQRPHPDDLRIAELKRQKLRIKDEIALLETEEKRVSA
ncbi:MAG TPA: YdcH family protein [Kiloniellales bacterium]